MRESLLRKHLQFISFVQETEGYVMTEKARSYVRDVLDDDMTADEVVSSVIADYQLKHELSTMITADGCYPDSEVYINHFGIRDQELLNEVETFIVAARMAEILAGPQEWQFDLDHLKTLHGRLFGDLYPFAGQIRSIAIAGHTIFCLPSYIVPIAQDIFKKRKEYEYLRNQ